MACPQRGWKRQPAGGRAGLGTSPVRSASPAVRRGTTAGTEASEDLRLELIGWARSHLGAALAPREIEFVLDLPHTRSGKTMRRLLRARELGLDEGDLSTLEPVS